MPALREFTQKYGIGFGPCMTNFSVLMQAVPQAHHRVALSTDGKKDLFGIQRLVACFCLVVGFVCFVLGDVFLENRKPRILCNPTVIT